jgi:hypothetical protein
VAALVALPAFGCPEGTAIAEKPIDPAAPPIMNKDRDSAALASEPDTPLRLGRLLITPNRTTLTDVQAAVGIGEIRSQGTMGRLCFDLPDAHQRIWLMSEERSVGGGITEVRVQQLDASAPPVSGCPALAGTFAPFQVGAIGLGASGEDVVRVFGEPGLRDSSWQYHHEGRDGVLDVVFIFRARFREGRVSEIRYYREEVDWSSFR